MTCSRFNIRVYGVLISGDKVLLSHENRFNKSFTKFPGGGLELGEGMIDCLKRELNEELEIDASAYKFTHLYTTDFFQESAFNPSDQIISVYYFCRLTDAEVDTINGIIQMSNNETESVSWHSILSLSEHDLTFPIDKYVLNEIKSLTLK